MLAQTRYQPDKSRPSGYAAVPADLTSADASHPEIKTHPKKHLRLIVSTIVPALLLTGWLASHFVPLQSFQDRDDDPPLVASPASVVPAVPSAQLAQHASGVPSDSSGQPVATAVVHVPYASSPLSGTRDVARPVASGGSVETQTGAMYPVAELVPVHDSTATSLADVTIVRTQIILATQQEESAVAATQTSPHELFALPTDTPTIVDVPQSLPFATGGMPTPTAIPKPSPSPIPTAMLAPTLVPSATPRADTITTPTHTPTPTSMSTDTPTDTPTPTSIPTDTPTPTALPTATSTDAPTHTPTTTPTHTPTPTSIPVVTETPTHTYVPTDTPTHTPMPTDTPIPTHTYVPTDTPTHTPMPTDTPIPTHTPMPTDTPIPTQIPNPTDIPVPPPPSIQSINPTRGLSTEDTQVTITGTHFDKHITVVLVNNKNKDEQVSLLVWFLSDTQLEVTVPKGTKSDIYDVVVTNPDGGRAMLENAFRILRSTVIVPIDKE